MQHVATVRIKFHLCLNKGADLSAFYGVQLGCNELPHTVHPLSEALNTCS